MEATAQPGFGFRMTWPRGGQSLVDFRQKLYGLGTVGENPFEGTANDVPISTISRGIEIDLRQMLDENDDEIPKQYPVMWDAQM